MVVISRRLISQVAASAAALVVSSAPMSGVVTGAAQPGVPATQASTAGATAHGSEHAAVARQIPSFAARRHGVDPDVLHHWSP